MVHTTLSVIILFGMIWFAVSNATPININLFFWNISVSTALVIFAMFTAGFVFGVLRVAPSWFRQHSQVGKHQQDLEACRRENEQYQKRITELVKRQNSGTETVQDTQ